MTSQQPGPSSSSTPQPPPPPLPPSSSYCFRPIQTNQQQQQQQHHRHHGHGSTGHHGNNNDQNSNGFESDSDVISSPNSSIVGPPPLVNSILQQYSHHGGHHHSHGGHGGSHSSTISSHHGSLGYLHQSIQHTYSLPLATAAAGAPHPPSTASQYPGFITGTTAPPAPYYVDDLLHNTPTGGGGNQEGEWNMYSPPPTLLAPASTHSLQFDDGSSWIATSDPPSSPELLAGGGSLRRKKRPPPRPPPRRLHSSSDYGRGVVGEYGDLLHAGGGQHGGGHGHHHHHHQRSNNYGSWPRESSPSSPAPSSAYHQQLAQLQEQGKTLGTAIALSEIRTQLQELTKSVENCQEEVTEVKRDVRSFRTDVNLVHHVKEELEDLKFCVERMEMKSRAGGGGRQELMEQSLTFFLSFSIFAAVLGMFQFGYNTGVINAPKQEIEKFMLEVHKERHSNDPDYEELNVSFLYSVVVSIFAIGGMLGGFGGGMVANRFGRKGGLLLNNLFGLAGALLMFLTSTFRSYELLILGRFVIGVHCGTNTILVPMYVSEIAPINLRGALGTVNQLAVTIGLLISQILGVGELLGNQEGWGTLLGLAIVPPTLQLLLLPACPESPRYLLITKQREEQARAALRKLRASANTEDDVDEMRAEIRAQQAEAKVSMLQLLRSSSLRAPLCIAVVMQLSQQLSGINAVLYYSTDFFTKAGLPPSQAKFASIGVGAIMVGMTLVSIMLIDRAGRRTLHLWGLGGMFVFSLFITIAMLCKEILDWISYLAVIFTLAFVVFFAVGPGSIPWMITAELFSQGPRSSAMAIAALTNWFANWLVSILFPEMQKALTSYVFLPFSALLAVFWTFTYNKVPETKNKTFEEISALFKEGGGRRRRHLHPDGGGVYGMLNNCEPLLVDAEKSSQSGGGGGQGQGGGGPESLSGRSTPPTNTGLVHRHVNYGLGASPPPNAGILSPPPPIVPFQIPNMMQGGGGHSTLPNYPQRYLDENGV